MSQQRDRELATFWAGLEILDRLAVGEDGLTSAEVAQILGVRNVKGIGQGLLRTRFSLEQAGIRLDEAVSKRSVRGRTVWMPGARIAQARHALRHARRYWTKQAPGDGVPVDDANDGHEGPVLVLRALKSRGTVYRIDGGIAELDDIVDDERLVLDEDLFGSIGEVFIHRIDQNDGIDRGGVPDGYGENGIWIRGAHDYAQPRVASAIGTGRHPMMIAWIGEATWVERRLVLVDAIGQVEKVRAGSQWLQPDSPSWRDVDVGRRFRHVRWIGTAARGSRLADGPRSAPPLRLRLRCWYEIVIETARRKRIVLRAEGLRGDEARTTAGAIRRWRAADASRASEPVGVRETRIAKRQTRPMAPA